MSKTILYKDLLARMRVAQDEGFFMESCWIQYAIIEDRLNSVIRHAFPLKGEQLLRTLRGLDRKLENISIKIHPDDEACQKLIHSDLLDRIKRWKNRRNVLMHDIVDTPDFAAINQKLSKLSPEGAKLVKELCSHATKYKAAVKKRRP